MGLSLNLFIGLFHHTALTNNIGVSVEMTELPRLTAGISAHNNADILPILDALTESSCNL